MKKCAALLLIISVLLTGCCNREKTVQGTVLDGAMNSLVVITQAGDTLAVSTIDVEKVAEDGILIGDNVNLTYQKGIITKVVVTPGNREVLLIGSWIQPIPGMEDQVQGITFNADGTATSINMATLLYETWQKVGDELTLTGKSVGNGQTIAFTDKYHIDTFNFDKLVLSKDGVTFEYSRSAE